MKVIIQNDDSSTYSEHDFPGTDRELLHCLTETVADTIEATLPNDLGLSEAEWRRILYLLECLTEAGYNKPARSFGEFEADYL